MVQSLNNLDVSLFLFLNGLHNSFFDFIFYWISYKFLWIPLYLYLAWFLYTREKSNYILLLILLGLTITMSDQLASTWLKNLVMRLRPCQDPLIAEKVHIVRGYCGGMYGFVSSHAANSFALYTFIVSIINSREWKFAPFLLLWAVIHSYSRIYLGAHYPGDVIAGALLGIIVALAMAKLFNRVKKKKDPSDKIPASS